jgi:multidrug efflux pump subunit AcrA (membrane-fusion protein)
MGQDNSVPEFHQELARLLGDPNPMVRRNAALALVRFGDAAGRDEIRGMLRPYAMPVPLPGTLSERMKPAETINPGTLLGHVTAGGGSSELRSEVPGTIERWMVADGAAVAAGQPILLIDPSDEEVRESLLALSLVGDQQDISAVKGFLRSTSPEVRRQAELTAQALEAQTAKPGCCATERN